MTQGARVTRSDAGARKKERAETEADSLRELLCARRSERLRAPVRVLLQRGVAMTASPSVSRAGLRCIASWGAFWVVSAAASVAVPAVPAQELPPDSTPVSAESRRSGWLLGAYGASFVPIGAWADHAYAGRTLGSTTYDEGLDQFGPGFGAGIDVGWKSSEALMLTLHLEGTTLSTGEWEAEAARHGSDVSSHAAQFGALLFLSIEVLESSPWRMDLRCGLGLMQAWGGETLRDPAVSYDYTFLRTSLTARAGVGGGYRISTAVDLTLLVDFVWATPGVRYPDHSAPYLGVVALLGPRIWFSAPAGA